MGREKDKCKKDAKRVEGKGRKGIVGKRKDQNAGNI